MSCALPSGEACCLGHVLTRQHAAVAPSRLQNSHSLAWLNVSIVLLCREMLATRGPYLLDIMVPHIQHVLPMIPGGGSYKDIITSGDGADVY
jgi:hypothetical protein